MAHNGGVSSGATTTTVFIWRANRRGKLRAILGVALVIGLIGGVALASLAGARRTASTFAAYERQNRLSHVAVNTFVPDLDRVRALAELPGVETSATWLGLDGYPVFDGEVIRDFRYTGVFGSYDGSLPHPGHRHGGLRAASTPRRRRRGGPHAGPRRVLRGRRR